MLIKTGKKPIFPILAEIKQGKKAVTLVTLSRYAARRLGFPISILLGSGLFGSGFQLGSSAISWS